MVPMSANLADGMKVCRRNIELLSWNGVILLIEKFDWLKYSGWQHSRYNLSIYYSDV